MDSKKTVLDECSRLKQNLESQGLDCEGLYFGIKAPRLSKNDDKILWRPEQTFLKIFPNELTKVVHKLTGPETLIAIAAMTFISYDSGMLRDDNGNALALVDIANVLDVSEKTVVRNMTSLVKKMVFFRGKTGENNSHKNAYQFFANPYIFMKGKYINKTLRDMFKDYKEK